MPIGPYKNFKICQKEVAKNESKPRRFEL